MNKNNRLAFALMTVMAAPTVSYANNDLFNGYGSIRVQLQDTSDGAVEYKDNYSRIGAYGGTEILDGVNANYNVEFRLFTDDGSFAGDDDRARLANVGLEGAFGSILIGKQYSPLWNFTDNAIDIMADIDESAGCTNESSGVICHTHRYGLWGNDAAGNGHYIEVLRPDRAVSYLSPELGGFQAAGLIMLNNGDVKANASGSEVEDLVGYNVAAKYVMGDFTLSASRFDVTALQGENKIDSLQLAYNRDNLSLAAHYQKSNDMRFYAGLNPAGEIVEESVYEVYAGYDLGSFQVQASYAIIEMDSPSNVTVDTDQFIVDLIYPHKHGNFYAEYSAWGSEAEAVYKAADKVVLGYRFNF